MKQTLVNNILSHNDLIKPIIPPIIWNLFGLFLSIYIIYNEKLLYIGIGITTFYLFLNLIFDYLTVELTVPEKYVNKTIFNTLSFLEHLYYPNKKYFYAKNDINNYKTTIDALKNNVLKTENKYIIYNINIYDGNYYFFKYLLFLIYWFGITPKNYVDTNIFSQLEITEIRWIDCCVHY